MQIFATWNLFTKIYAIYVWTSMKFYYFFISFLFSIFELFSQGTVADYERAANHGRKFNNGKLKNHRIKINWDKSEKYVWYRVEISPGKPEYYSVDLKSGKILVLKPRNNALITYFVWEKFENGSQRHIVDKLYPTLYDYKVVRYRRR